MSHEPDCHVVFLYIGPLQSRGRMLKQIATLQKVGVHCEVILGNTLSEQPAPEEFSFPIRSIPFDSKSGKLRSFLELMKFARAAGPMIADSGADTVVCVALESLMAGVRAKRLRPNLRLVFDNNELHIESFDEPVKRMIWRPIHNRAIRRCDVILHAEANRLAYFHEHYPLPDTPQVVIENFPFFVGELPERTPPGGEVRVIYLGGFGRSRFTEEIIDAFATFGDSIRLDIVGFGFKGYVDEMQKRIESLGATNIRIRPPVPYVEISKLLRSYHIGVALYRNTNLNNYYCAPNKVYDYLMNGLPVITNDYPGLVPVIEENRVGACIEDVSAPELRKAIGRIRDDRMWENITTEIRRRYCWERQEARYLRVFGHRIDRHA